MKNTKSIPFRAYVRVYLFSGDSYEVAERVRNGLSNRFAPFINEIGLAMTSDIFDQYEDECHEMMGIRQSVISFCFEGHAPTLDLVVDYSLFLRSLARLMDARYSNIVCYEVDDSYLSDTGAAPSTPRKP